jgi:hypothetical protein
MQHLKELKSFYPKKCQRAFPFGDGTTNSSLLNTNPFSYLPQREILTALISQYFITFDKIFPLLDEQEFKREYMAFCDAPDGVSKAWIAQLFMMIALSCHTNPQLPPSAIPGGPRAFSQNCIDAAEIAFLSRGNYLSKPTLTDIRVMCMIAIAKHLNIVTLKDLPGTDLWVYIGFITRLGMTRGLHMSSRLFPDMPEAEIRAHQRIWTTVVLLSISISLLSGHRLPVQPDDFDTAAIYDPNQEPFGLHPRKQPYTYQQLVAKIFPTLATIINKANSTDPNFDSIQFHTLDMNLRQLLQFVKSTYDSPFIRSTEAFMQHALLETLIHRCFLALNYQYFLVPKVSPEPALSRSTIHTSSQTLVLLHEKLFADPTYKWFETMFISHYSLPAGYMVVCLRIDDYDEIPMPSCPESSRDNAWRLLRQSTARIKTNLINSQHQFKMFRGFTCLMAALEAEKEGRSVANALYSSAQEILNAVEQAFGQSIGGGPDVSMADRYPALQDFDLASLDLVSSFSITFR